MPAKHIIKNFSGLVKGKLASERKLVLEIAEASLKAVMPSFVIPEKVKLNKEKINVAGKNYSLKKIENVLVIGFGKASGEMARSLYKILGKKINKGIVASQENSKVGSIKIMKADHPLTGEKTISVSKQIMKLAEEADKKTIVFVLISGGGSAMFELPAERIKLTELRKLNNLLIKNSVNICEINTVRKHLSTVKGGLLAKKLSPATVISLVISDVPSNNLSSIASGPTAIDKTSYKDAVKILKKHKIWRTAPASVRKHLLAGMNGKAEETAKTKKELGKVENYIIASAESAAHEAVNKAREMKIKVKLEKKKISGEARIQGPKFVHRNNLRKGIVIATGETTVNVKGKGNGGRNQEFALASVKGIKEKTVLLCLASDGKDGDSNYAGAIIDSETRKKAEKLKLDPNKFLKQNNSTAFFKRTRNGIVTGNTETNVSDVFFLYCGE